MVKRLCDFDFAITDRKEKHLMERREGGGGKDGGKELMKGWVRIGSHEKVFEESR